MTDSVNLGRRRSAVARTIAWVIFIIWGAFWIFFNVASGFAEYGDLGIGGLMSHLVPAIILLVVMWISLRWEIWGGLLLILAGLVAAFMFNMNVPGKEPIQSLLLFSVLGLPALLVGMLLVLCGMEVLRAAKKPMKD